MVEEKNIRLILEYDGTLYHGWQRQKGDTTVQEVIEDSIHVMTLETPILHASGRTDAGVHALHQVCHFLTKSNIPPESMRKGLNSLLPNDIFIVRAEYVPLNFHSRFNAKSKVYEYRILNQPEPDIFLRNFIWHISKKLDYDKMRTCLTILIGKYDFSSFRSTGSENKDPVRKVTRAELLESGENRYHLIFEANGFLRHMVRNIVGTMIDVGLGKTTVNEFEEIFHSKDRCRAGIKAPPQGLFLKIVKY